MHHMKLLANVENLYTIITYYQIIAAEIIIKWEREGGDLHAQLLQNAGQKYIQHEN